MADEIDVASEREEELRNSALRRQRSSAVFAVGQPGECEECGEDHVRIVGGRCPRCRDRG